MCSFIRQKPSTSEHFLIPFTGAQAEAAEGDYGDHRKGGGPGEGDLVRESCDGAVGGAPVYGGRHYLRIYKRLRYPGDHKGRRDPERLRDPGSDREPLRVQDAGHGDHTRY